MTAKYLLKFLTTGLIPLLVATGCSDCGETPPDTNNGGGNVDQDMSGGGQDGGQADMTMSTDNCSDLDGDGALAGANCAAATDCNDTSPSVNPGAAEACGDGIDNNCNGIVDEECPCITGELKSCSSAPIDPLAFGAQTRCKPGVLRCINGAWSDTCEGEIGPQEESCNQIDDDCDGEIDEGQRNAFGLCLDDLPDDYMPPVESCGPTNEGDGLDNNGDGQVDEGCSCALPDEAPDSAGTRVDQPCYAGPPSTLGVGLCKGGSRDCVQGVWGECGDSVLPVAEVCGDGEDNDCDGIVDNGCVTCMPSGDELCDGIDNDCDGVIDEGVRNACGGCGEVATDDTCGDGLDNDCDGRVDEGCGCPAATQDCYTGPPESAGVGICAYGTQACEGEEFGSCNDSVLPQLESCGADNLGDGLDNDCDGQVDEGCGECQDGQARQCGSSTGVCEYGTQTCVGNQWGACEGGTPPSEANETLCDGEDNDCDGLTDEGLLNACGKCGETCYTEDFDPTGDGNIDDSVDIIPADDPDNPRDEPGITLGKKTSFPAFLWAANNNEDQVSRIDTLLDEEVGRYWVGDNPSRTAVDLDGNMWVIGRNDGRVTKILWNEQDCAANDRNNNGMIDTSRRVGGVVTVVNSAADPYADECVAYSEVLNTGFPSGRGIAVTADGIVWFGFSVSGQSGGIQGIDARSFDKTPNYPNTNIPYYSRDAATGINALTTETRNFDRIYGLISDSDGNVWANTWAGNNGLAKFNTTTRTWDEYYDLPNCGTYGIAVDGNDRIWAGCWKSNDAAVGMLDINSRYSESFALPATGYNPSAPPVAGTSMDALTSTELGQARTFLSSAVGVEPATNDVWVTHNDASGVVSRFTFNENSPADSTFTIVRALLDDSGAKIPGVSSSPTGMRGIGFDSDGYAWYLGLSTSDAVKIDPATNKNILTVPMPGTSGHYTYSDFTGSSVFSITAPRGIWRTLFETAFPNSIVTSLTISAEVPVETTLGIRLRTIDAQDGSPGAWIPAVMGGAEYETYPAGAMSHTFDLTTFGGPLYGEFFELEVQFSTSDKDIRPIIYDIQLGWSRP